MSSKCFLQRNGSIYSAGVNDQTSQRVIPTRELHKMGGNVTMFRFYSLFAIRFKNSIIQEQNAKEIIAVKESLYLIKTHVDFHKQQGIKLGI